MYYIKEQKAINRQQDPNQPERIHNDQNAGKTALLSFGVELVTLQADAIDPTGHAAGENTAKASNQLRMALRSDPPTGALGRQCIVHETAGNTDWTTRSTLMFRTGHDKGWQCRFIASSSLSVGPHFILSQSLNAHSQTRPRLVRRSACR